MKRLFDDEDRYSLQSAPIVTLVDATLAPLIKQVSEAGYSLRDLELLIVREAGTMISETILRKQLAERQAKHPLPKFSRPSDDPIEHLKDRLGLRKGKKR